MAQLPSSFNSNEHDDMQDFSAFEVKDVPAQIVKSSMEKTKAYKENGSMFLKIEFKILSGKYKGNHVWTQLNLVNPSEKAVEIANKELATICRACGKVTVADSQELHGIPLLISTKIEKGGANYPDKTAISMYKKYEGGDSLPAESSKGDAPDDAKGGKKKPWE